MSASPHLRPRNSPKVKLDVDPSSVLDFPQAVKVLTLDCYDDADCAGDNVICVIQSDGYFAQCIDWWVRFEQPAIDPRHSPANSKPRPPPPQ